MPRKKKTVELPEEEEVVVSEEASVEEEELDAVEEEVEEVKETDEESEESLEPEESAPEEVEEPTAVEVTAVPDKPHWVDPTVWSALSEKGKIALCGGASVADAKCL